MDHPAIDIIQTVLGGTNPMLPEAFKRFKSDIWDLPVWVPGHATERGGTKFLFQTNGAQRLPKLSMFSDEQEARTLWGSGPCMAIPFKYAIYLANEKQYDLDLFFDRQLLSLNHDKLLEMRDLVALQHSSEAMTPQEARHQENAVKEFIGDARNYCCAKPDIETLHIAIVCIKGSKPRLAAALKSHAGHRHEAALLAIGMKKFLPQWGLRFFHHDGHERAWIDLLNAVAPSYDKATFGSMRERFARIFMRVPRVESELAPDEHIVRPEK